jgi:hypothetical protein
VQADCPGVDWEGAQIQNSPSTFWISRSYEKDLTFADGLACFKG